MKLQNFLKSFFLAASIVFLTLFLLLLVPIHSAGAQSRSDWSDPQRLSSLDGLASAPSLVADESGYIHAIWSEVLSNATAIIQYASFDGKRWSVPVDIYVTDSQDIGSPRITLEDGQLFVVWEEGSSGAVNYMSSNPAEALASSARVWSEVSQVNVSAFDAILHIDHAGTMHLVFSEFFGRQPGMYYAYSVDDGFSWSLANWLDPDIPDELAPLRFDFQIDSEGNMHVVWWYVDASISGTPGQWVRYTSSHDGGTTWSRPQTIDRDELGNGEVREAAPVMALVGPVAHIVWASGDSVHRSHAWLNSATNEWQVLRRIPAFGELQGQAFDSLITDASGRIHFTGQIRSPAGIYHAVWDDGSWQRPILAYPIAEGIHAHNVASAIAQGNQLVVLFTDSPNDENIRVYAIESNLKELTALASMVAAPQPNQELEVRYDDGPTESNSEVDAQAVNAAVSDPVRVQAIVGDPPMSNPLANLAYLGWVPALVLVGVLLFVQVLRKRLSR